MSYQPRPGSCGYNALRALQAHGKPMSAEALSVACDVMTTSLAGNIVVALRERAITQKTADGITWYGLPEWEPKQSAPRDLQEAPAAPAAKRLSAAENVAVLEAERAVVVQQIREQSPTRQTESPPQVRGIDIDAVHDKPWRGVVNGLAKAVETPQFQPDDTVEAVKVDVDESDEFVIGLFSDGRLELHMGKSVISLPRKHTEALVRFLDFLAPEAFIS